jgi:hypothetical protein
MSTSSSKLLVAAGVVGGSFLWTSAASAEDGVVFGIDGEWVQAGEGEGQFAAADNDEGLGLHARLGYQSEAGLLYLRPEVGASATFFDDIDDDIQWRGYGGGRLGLTTAISPAAFVHGGYGWYSNDERGFTWDFGGALDLLMFEPLSVGAHVSYVMNPDPVPNWFTVGGHIEFLFY